MCTVCNTARDAHFEETWQLPVAVPSSITPALQTYALADLIAHYGGVEKDVNVKCRQCGGNTPHDSRPSYLQTPRVLVIQALRFLVPKTPLSSTTILDTESTTGTDSPTDSSSEPLTAPRRKKRLAKRKVIKNPAHITFPLTSLDMTSYLQTPSTEEELYDLFAVVEHVGRRMDGGHYIAYIRGKDGAGKDCWWKCNDAKCWIVSNETVSAAQGYIWFYERRTQRGVIPEDWGGVLPIETERGILPAVKDSLSDGVGLATPECDEASVTIGMGWEDGERKRDVSWEGRLRRSSA
jgi:ubiquitin C-terminal hydrolase